MAIKDIEQMTAPLSRKGETQMAMSDAPEDYLKRAVEQFIIDFPEFEDLQGQDLYNKMEEKGYFSDRYASSDYGIPITPDYRRQMLLDGYGSHRHGYSDNELRNMDDDAIREIYDELNEMFRDAKLKQPRDIRRVNQGGIIELKLGGMPKMEQTDKSEGIMQLASSGGNDIIQSAIIWAAGLEQFGSIDAVVKSLEDGSTDMNGLINAYMDAVGDMN
jgi:hypothetical protein